MDVSGTFATRLDGLQAVLAQESLGAPKMYPSPGLGAWLWSLQATIVFSTYQAGRICFASGTAAGECVVFDRVVGPAMGLACDADTLWVANREQIWRFANVGPAHIDGEAWDGVFMPRTGHFIGNCDAHDVLMNVSVLGEAVGMAFVNTRASCVATIDDQHSFRPLWVPPFITTLAPDDRCHLNGLGAVDGEAAYVTLCMMTDEPMGWRDGDRQGQGVVMDIRDNRVVCRGLTMPHSPRWHNGRLWLLDSGTASLGYVDMATERFVPVATTPGFARGMLMVGNRAVIGLSRLRTGGSGSQLGVGQLLADRRLSQRCGLQIVDLDTGRTVDWLTIEGGVTELYDVALLSGLARVFTPGFREPGLHKDLMTVPSAPVPTALRPAADVPLVTSAAHREAAALVTAERTHPTSLTFLSAKGQ